MMRSLLQTMLNALLFADADAVVGAEYRQPSTGRVVQRNDYRHRGLDRANLVDHGGGPRREPGHQPLTR